jgi:hypothetical protein
MAGFLICDVELLDSSNKDLVFLQSLHANGGTICLIGHGGLLSNSSPIAEHFCNFPIYESCEADKEIIK